MMHKYYEPTEYEQMLIAAGWVSIETLDTDYIEFTSKQGRDLSYNNWVYLKRDWDELDALYRQEINPLYMRDGYTLTRDEERRASNLISRMSEIETTLGY